MSKLKGSKKSPLEGEDVTEAAALLVGLSQFAVAPPASTSKALQSKEQNVKRSSKSKPQTSPQPRDRSPRRQPPTPQPPSTSASKKRPKSQTMRTSRKTARRDSSESNAEQHDKPLASTTPLTHLLAAPSITTTSITTTTTPERYPILPSDLKSLVRSLQNNSNIHNALILAFGASGTGSPQNCSTGAKVAPARPIVDSLELDLNSATFRLPEGDTSKFTTITHDRVRELSLNFEGARTAVANLYRKLVEDTRGILAQHTDILPTQTSSAATTAAPESQTGTFTNSKIHLAAFHHRRCEKLVNLFSEQAQTSINIVVDRARQQASSEGSLHMAARNGRSPSRKKRNLKKHQVTKPLIKYYNKCHHPDAHHKLLLASKTGMTYKEVATWFANRRTRCGHTVRRNHTEAIKTAPTDDEVRGGHIHSRLEAEVAAIGHIVKEEVDAASDLRNMPMLENVSSAPADTSASRATDCKILSAQNSHPEYAMIGYDQAILQPQHINQIPPETIPANMNWSSMPMSISDPSTQAFLQGYPHQNSQLYPSPPLHPIPTIYHQSYPPQQMMTPPTSYMVELTPYYQTQPMPHLQPHHISHIPGPIVSPSAELSNVIPDGSMNAPPYLNPYPCNFYYDSNFSSPQPVSQCPEKNVRIAPRPSTTAARTVRLVARPRKNSSRSETSAPSQLTSGAGSPIPSKENDLDLAHDPSYAIDVGDDASSLPPHLIAETIVNFEKANAFSLNESTPMKKVSDVLFDVQNTLGGHDSNPGIYPNGSDNGFRVLNAAVGGSP